jgi:hypothetical protein
LAKDIVLSCVELVNTIQLRLDKVKTSASKTDNQKSMEYEHKRKTIKWCNGRRENRGKRSWKCDAICWLCHLISLSIWLNQPQSLHFGFLTVSSAKLVSSAKPDSVVC